MVVQEVVPASWRRIMFCMLCLALFRSGSGGSQALGQATFATSDPSQAYFDARQWFHDGDYFIAYPVFRQLEREWRAQGIVSSQRQLQLEELEFYILACELMQGNIAAEKKAADYLQQNSSETLKGQLGYYLGMHHFRKDQPAQAIEAFERASIANLTNRQIAEMQFAHGYSLFTQKQFVKAKPLLNSVRQMKDGPYYMDANYYYGLLAFNDRNYREALGAFEIARNHAKYQPLVPYYTASIQYATGQKDKGLESAERALKQGNQHYAAELNQLIGHAYFEKGDYATALPYLEKYVNASDKVKREDLYELAYCYYVKQDWPKAIERFRPLSNGKDSLSQHAMYLLGDSYLKTNQKANAKTAFQFCADNSSNPTIREPSMFNAGKLAFELGFDDEATGTLKNFLSLFPQSRYRGEAQDLLVNALANTSNYREALQLYETLANKSEATQRLFPRLLYNRAQEEINDKQYAAAAQLIDRGLQARYNEPVKPHLNFWKGELAYLRGDYPTAVRHLREYLDAPVTNGEANPAAARYNLGYSYLMLGEYGQAQREFEQLSRGSGVPPQIQEDVQVRLADSYYMQKSFAKAQPIYTSLTDRRSTFADYALFQNGMIAGAENKAAQKISLLQSLERQYPNSELVPAALMEIAKTYQSDEKFREAIPFLNKIVNGRGGESLKPEAYLKLGLAHYNLGNNDEAIAQFRTLLTRYGQSPEAEEAVDNVRSIYVELGRPNDFVSFMQQVGRRVDTSVADSLSYTAAELQLSEGRKEAALKSFTDYLQRYPDGRYVVAASYNAAELHRERKDPKAAVALYEAVVSRAPNRYAEASMLQAARLHYFEWKDYKKASGFYQQLKDYATSADNRLEAMRGLVRCQYYLGDYASATKNANDLLEQKGAGSDDRIFANLVLGKNAQQQGNCTEATRYYNAVANLSKAEYGAEARYQIAACLFEQGKLSDAEKAAFEVIKKSGSYAEWVTKSYILLGDIYHKQQDYFNAKATYKSVAENAVIPELKAEAAAKLAKVEQEEREKSKLGG